MLLTAKMLIDELVYRAENALPLPIVILHDIGNIDTYFDKGMKTTVQSVEEFGEGIEGETVYKFNFEFSKFRDFNKEREIPNYYDEEGNPTLKASESGNYPAHDRETLYIGDKDDNDYFLLVDYDKVDSPNTVHFSSSENKDMVTRALWDLKELYTMRFNEANQAGAVKEVKRSSEALLIVMATLKDMYR